MDVGNEERDEEENDQDDDDEYRKRLDEMQNNFNERMQKTFPKD